MRVVARYALFQIPGDAAAAVVLWLLHSFEVLPLWSAVALMGLWIAKDVVQYPFLRRAYDSRLPGVHVGADRLIDAIGLAEDELDPTGYVRVHGELWQAECARGPIPRGSEVRVRGVRDLTLLVSPAGD